MAGCGTREKAAALKQAASDPHTASGDSFACCPICRKPFEQDEEVGPVPTCDCGTRGKEDPSECPLPTDNERMMNAKWNGPDYD